MKSLQMPTRNTRNSTAMHRLPQGHWHSALPLQAGAIFLLAGLASQARAEVASTISLCSKAERTVFSCQIKGTGKVVSVCSSTSLRTPERYLQYRFGRAGAIELSYPPQPAKSVAAFTASHYFRARVDRRQLSFSSQGVRYTIFADYEAEEPPERTEAGVVIGRSPQGGREVTLRCRAPFVDHLADLDGMVVPEADPPEMGEHKVRPYGVP